MIRTVLFDVDGVMLSEERYFDASALTVHELLFSKQYLGWESGELNDFQANPTESTVRAIRQAVFADDAVLRRMKQVGVNANWDMVYIQVVVQLAALIRSWTELRGAKEVVRQLRDKTVNGWDRHVLSWLGGRLREDGVHHPIVFANALPVLNRVVSKSALFEQTDALLTEFLLETVTGFESKRALWDVGRQTFQEWYLGDQFVPETRQPGKRGFLKDEIVLVPVDEFSRLLQDCRMNGIEIGIATGRPTIETRVPLGELGWLQFFDDARITTASDVLAAEQNAPATAPLSKPHPYSYLRSYLKSLPAQEVLEFKLPLEHGVANEVLVVGDSVADCLAAQAMGSRFAAVLTGLEGEAARAQFSELGSDYILRDVLELRTVLFP